MLDYDIRLNPSSPFPHHALHKQKHIAVYNLLVWVCACVWISPAGTGVCVFLWCDTGFGGIVFHHYRGSFLNPFTPSEWPGLRSQSEERERGCERALNKGEEIIGHSWYNSKSVGIPSASERFPMKWGIGETSRVDVHIIPTKRVKWHLLYSIPLSFSLH